MIKKTFYDPLIFSFLVVVVEDICSPEILLLSSYNSIDVSFFVNHNHLVWSDWNVWRICCIIRFYMLLNKNQVIYKQMRYLWRSYSTDLNPYMTVWFVSLNQTSWCLSWLADYHIVWRQLMLITLPRCMYIV